MSKINLQEIADGFIAKLDDLYSEDIKNLVVDAVNSVDKSDPNMMQTTMLVGLANSIKNHSERFTIQLIQEVLDRYEKTE